MKENDARSRAMAGSSKYEAAAILPKVFLPVGKARKAAATTATSFIESKASEVRYGVWKWEGTEVKLAQKHQSKEVTRWVVWIKAHRAHKELEYLQDQYGSFHREVSLHSTSKMPFSQPKTGTDSSVQFASFRT